MTRWLLYRFIPYYLTLSLLLSFGFLALTETGLRVLWTQAKPRLPAELSIGSVKGRLIGQITLDNLSYQDKDNQIQIAKAWVRWQPSALFRGEIRINEIVVADAHIQWQNPSTEEQPEDKAAVPESLPKLPNVILESLQLRQIEYRDQASAYQLVKLDLSASVREQNFELKISELDTREFGSWQLLMQGYIHSQAFKLKELNVQGLANPKLHVAGQAECAWPSLNCESKLSWSELRWPLLQEAQWRSPIGELSLSSQDQRLSLDLDTDIAGHMLPESELVAKLRPDKLDKHYQLQLSYLSPTGKLKLTTKLDQQEQSAKGRLEIDQLNLSFWDENLESALDGHVDFAANATEQTVSSLALQGQIRQQEFALKAGAKHADGNWAVSNIGLQFGQNTVTGQLRREQQWQGDLRLEAKALEQIYPGLSGRVVSSLQLTGKPAFPHIVVALKADELLIFDNKIKHIESSIALNDKALEASIKGRNLDLPGAFINQIELHSSGPHTQAKHQLSLDSSVAILQLGATSQLKQNNTLSLALTQGKLNLGNGNWVLQDAGPIDIQVEQSKFKLGPQCWQADTAETCVQASWLKQKLAAELNLSNYPMQRLNSQLPGTTELDGLAHIQLRIPSSKPEALKFSLQAQSTPIALYRRIADEPEKLLQFAAGELNAEGLGRDVQANWALPIDAEQGISGHLNVTNGEALAGELKLELKELELLTALSSEVVQAKGRLLGHWGIAGTLSEPKLDGELRLNQGDFLLSGAGIHLEDVQASVQGKGLSALELDLMAKSGPGYLKASGKMDWAGDALALQTQIQGERFLASNHAEAQVQISPDLNLRVAGQNINLQGRILVPYANIEPVARDTSQVLAPSSDQIISGEESRPSAYKVSSQVELELGKEVAFKGFGLKTQLSGKLKTQIRPGKTATGLGQLALVNGHYQAYGQNLVIERGRLIFSGGPLSEPGLDIQAYRQATKDIRAGVRVRGPLRKPELELYSDPLMRETDQLSYLVLGRPAEAKSEDDQAALNNAALALGLKGGDFISNKLKGRLGLDEVRLGTQAGESTAQASLVLGKYLSPDLYVSYGIGLFEPIYTFRLRYQLSEKWSLQTESGVESSGDLFYTIER